MRVLVAGASGAIGTRLVPQLIERGHARRPAPRGRPRGRNACGALGAKSIALDLLDARAGRKAVLEASRTQLSTRRWRDAHLRAGVLWPRGAQGLVCMIARIAQPPSSGRHGGWGGAETSARRRSVSS
jgi:hypothetical protein